MCGIVGYVGKRPVQGLLLEGLTRLEYRGYDSAGISMIAGDAIDSVRAVGNLDHLRDAVSARAEEDSGSVATATRTATTGIGHTRWATHGRVNEENAHPHFDTADRVHIVVNGIVENYLSMRQRLTDMGAVFTSETDAEVIAHLIAHHLATGSLLEAVRAAYAELEGHYAFVAMSLDEPETLVGARKECPLIVGRGEGETFFASAIPAFLRETRQVQYIENGEIVEITPEGTTFVLPDGTELEREVLEIDWDEETAEKGGFETFMLKEIHEQADAVAETIADRTVRSDGVDLEAIRTEPVEGKKGLQGCADGAPGNVDAEPMYQMVNSRPVTSISGLLWRFRQAVGADGGRTSSSAVGIAVAVVFVELLVWLTMTSPENGSTIFSSVTRPMMRSRSGSMISPDSTIALASMPSIVPQSISWMITSCATSTRRRVR